MRASVTGVGVLSCCFFACTKTPQPEQPTAKEAGAASAPSDTASAPAASASSKAEKDPLAACQHPDPIELGKKVEATFVVGREGGHCWLFHAHKGTRVLAAITVHEGGGNFLTIDPAAPKDHFAHAVLDTKNASAAKAYAIDWSGPTPFKSDLDTWLYVEGGGKFEMTLRLATK